MCSVECVRVSCDCARLSTFVSVFVRQILTISNAAGEHQQKDYALEMHGWKMEKDKIT